MLSPTSDRVLVGAACNGAGKDRERVVEGHGGGDADADGVAGAAVDAEDDAAHARALALVHVPHVPLPRRVPLHLQYTRKRRTLTEVEEEGEESCPGTNCYSEAEVSFAAYICMRCGCLVEAKGTRRKTTGEFAGGRLSARASNGETADLFTPYSVVPEPGGLCALLTCLRLFCLSCTIRLSLGDRENGN
ncbi:unnamed protein product [Urochloa humidicola]